MSGNKPGEKDGKKSRVEENAKLRLPSGLRTDKEIWMAQAKFLEDISRSLAVIADAEMEFLHSETESPINPMEVIKGVKIQ